MRFLAVGLCVFLGGCVLATQTDDIDQGHFIVDSDCGKQRVKVELNLDRDRSRDDVNVTK